MQRTGGHCALNRGIGGASDDGGNDPKKNSCFTMKELKALAQAYNATESVISGQKEPIAFSESESFDSLYGKLFRVFGKKCRDNEACWIDNKELRDRLRRLDPEQFKILDQFVFKPKGTRKRNGWLATSHIDQVNAQFEQVFTTKYYKYIGCFPSDEYLLDTSKKKLRELVADVMRQKHSAIVFNDDPTHERGSHWVAVFFTWHNNEEVYGVPNFLDIEFFDSTGHEPVEGIAQTLELIEEILHSLPGVRVNVSVNKKKHQKGDTECGVYSLFYIYYRLQGVPAAAFAARRISDSEVSEFRDFFFRPYSHYW